MEKLRVGLIGCGVISDIYLKTCQKFDILDVVACASLDFEESRGKAETYDIPKVCSSEEVFQDPDIDCVLNLTIPAAHVSLPPTRKSALRHLKQGNTYIQRNLSRPRFKMGKRFLPWLNPKDSMWETHRIHF